uniref:BZIP domain-containing protein n=1 Tax=Davidia involucrata TaxID=16924 RepID=A0A5B7B2E9_DAVIN
MTANRPGFPHQRMTSLENFEPNTPTQNNPSWVDEFLDFSSAKRGSHRRSISNSIAFLEPPPATMEECRRLSAPGYSGTNTDFDRFNDEQFMSMFTDYIATDVGPTVSSSNPSTPSDHNSINDDKQAPSDQQLQQLKNESEEVQSSCKSDGQGVHATRSNSDNKIIDPKRVKRILANRQSAQRSRVRKLQYISELERSVTSLQAEVSVLSPRVAFLDHHRLVLNVDNTALKQRIAALTQDKVFKDAHQEAMKREIERLRQVYYQQNLKNMENATPPSQSTPSSNANASTEEEQLLHSERKQGCMAPF